MKSRLQGRRILVVEDNFIVADELARDLREAGAEVLGPAATVDAALAMVAAQGDGLHAAVLDVDLRGQLCYPVAEALKARGVRIVFVTGFDSPAIQPPWTALPRLMKPLKNGALIEALL